MDFDPLSLAVSFVISGVGFVLFSYGRKLQRAPQVISGLMLLVFPYFSSGPLLTGAIALGVLAALWGALHAGW